MDQSGRDHQDQLPEQWVHTEDEGQDTPPATMSGSPPEEGASGPTCVLDDDLLEVHSTRPAPR